MVELDSDSLAPEEPPYRTANLTPMGFSGFGGQSAGLNRIKCDGSLVKDNKKLNDSPNRKVRRFLASAYLLSVLSA
eukprot:5030140-Pleurochrysis_carterae.AAC.3